MTSETIPKSRLDETAELRKIISDCASALPNGAFVSPDTSLGFMALLPSEISACCARLKAESEALSAQLERVTDPAYLATALDRIGAVDADWKARAETAEAKVEELTKERDDFRGSLATTIGKLMVADMRVTAAESSLASVTAEREAMRAKTIEEVAQFIEEWDSYHSAGTDDENTLIGMFARGNRNAKRKLAPAIRALSAEAKP